MPEESQKQPFHYNLHVYEQLSRDSVHARGVPEATILVRFTCILRYKLLITTIRDIIYYVLYCSISCEVYYSMYYALILHITFHWVPSLAQNYPKCFGPSKRFPRKLKTISRKLAPQFARGRPDLGFQGPCKKGACRRQRVYCNSHVYGQVFSDLVHARGVPEVTILL